MCVCVLFVGVCVMGVFICGVVCVFCVMFFEFDVCVDVCLICFCYFVVNEIIVVDDVFIV